MKSKLKLLLTVTFAVTLIGCSGTLDRKTTPTGGTEYVPAAWVTNTIAQVSNVSKSLPPNPVSPFLDLALALTSLGVAGYARFKTVQANKQATAADLLAATVVQAGKSMEALKVSSGTTAHEAVAKHIDNNTL